MTTQQTDPPRRPSRLPRAYQAVGGFRRCVRAGLWHVLPSAHPAGEYVPPSVAARRVGASPTLVCRWGDCGKVAASPGPHGRLVRLPDVLVYAAQRGLASGAPRYLDTEPEERP